MPSCFFVFWEIRLKLDEWKLSLVDRFISGHTLFLDFCGTDVFLPLPSASWVSLSGLKHTEVRTENILSTYKFITRYT